MPSLLKAVLPFILLAHGALAYALVESLSLAANDDGLVAVANQHGTRSVAISLDESLVRRASRTFDGAGDIAWDGASFVLALREREQITLRRVDANLRDAARPRIASLAAPDTAGAMASVAVAIPGNAIVGVQECDTNSGCRAVAYAEQELELEPQRRRTVRR